MFAMAKRYILSRFVKYNVLLVDVCLLSWLHMFKKATSETIFEKSRGRKGEEFKGKYGFNEK